MPLSLAAVNGKLRSSRKKPGMKFQLLYGWEAFKLLLETGKAEVHSKDNNSRTPLSWAAKKGHEAGKAKVNCEDEDHRTPLSYAAEKGHEAVVKVLLEMGKADVDANAKDRYGRTPLSYAVGNGHEAVVKLLQSLGSS